MSLSRRVLIGLFVLLGVSGAALAQDEGNELESLDALLGLEENEQGAETGGELDIPDESQVALDRTLSVGEAREKLGQAVAEMGDAAVRLEKGRDVGVQTQRLGESILKKLDQVIASAQQQEQQSSSSSSSKQQQQQQQQAQHQQGRPEQKGTPSPESAVDSPGRRDGELADVQAGGAAAWGRLPARTRDALVEGLSDRYSALYERLTEAYYRRLAEDHP